MLRALLFKKLQNVQLSPSRGVALYDVIIPYMRRSAKSNKPNRAGRDLGTQSLSRYFGKGVFLQANNHDSKSQRLQFKTATSRF